MHEPIPSIATAGGLVIFGFVTGLHPGLILAGAIGCWLMLILTQSDHSRLERSAIVFISGITASWFTPAASSGLKAFSVLPTDFELGVIGFPVAATFGFALVPIIAPFLLRMGKKRAEEISGD